MPADEQVTDTDWIEEAAKRRWPILMKDKRIRHRHAEITAVTEHKARCFVITRGDLSSADMAQRLITNKAAILAAVAEPGPYIYSVRWTGSPASIHSRAHRSSGPSRGCV